jgi:hypothetical protein
VIVGVSLANTLVMLDIQFFYLLTANSTFLDLFGNSQVILCDGSGIYFVVFCS